MWVSAVRPEDEQAVKQRFDVGDHTSSLWVYLEQASVNLGTHTYAHTHTHTHTATSTHTVILEFHLLMIHADVGYPAGVCVCVYLDIPALVQVVYTGDAAPVSVRIVHVTDITCAVARVTRYHGLKRDRERGKG